MRTLLLAATVAACAIGFAGSSFAAEHVEVGSLDCDVSAGVGLIVTEHQSVTCAFKPTGSGAVENYTGKINEIGIDLGTTTKGKMAWLVYAPASRDKDALAGTYTGVSADAAVGLGLGANALVGGQHGTVSLQPISVKTEEGLNIAVGISALKLEAAK